MTAIITIAIILALFLGVAIVIAMRKHYAAERLRLKVKSLNAKIQGYRGSANDCFALYSVKRIDNVEVSIMAIGLCVAPLSARVAFIKPASRCSLMKMMTSINVRPRS